MIKSGDSLETVLQNLIDGKKVKNIIQENRIEEERSRSRSRSARKERSTSASRIQDLKKRVSEVNLKQVTAFEESATTQTTGSSYRGMSFREASPYSKRKTIKEVDNPLELQKFSTQVNGKSPRRSPTKKEKRVVRQEVDVSDLEAKRKSMTKYLNIVEIKIKKLKESKVEII